MSAYLDHAATSPLRAEVIESYTEDLRVLSQTPGNPNALHADGRKVREMLEDARARVAESLHADPAEVVFTSGATESNSLAVLGTLHALKQAGESGGFLTDGLEHPAIAALGKRWREEGGETLVAQVSAEGIIQADSVSQISAQHDCAVAAFMAVSNEVGTIQPIKELAAAAHSHGVQHVHCDGAQGVGHLALDFHQLGIDSLSFSGHKIGAPGGIGALLIKRSVPLLSDRLGGGQERSLRSGTQNVAGARALAHALEIADKYRDEETKKLEELKQYLSQRIDPRAEITTSAPTAPHIFHLTLPTQHPEVILMVMDRAGVSVSAASACAAGVSRPSAALLAMGRSESAAMGALRVSLGWDSTTDDVDAFIAALGPALDAAANFERGNA